ncbi:MAG: substrate-binding domain-containing protein [Promethearchaeota archaeon]
MSEEIILKILKKKKDGLKILLVFTISFFTGIVTGTAIGSNVSSHEVLFSMAFSSEKEGWIGEIKDDFIKWYNSRYDDIQIKLNFFPAGSRESIIALLNGQYKPAIWSPAASTWIPILNYLWGEEHPGSQVLTSINKTVVFSPIVMATWSSLLEKENISSIMDVYELSKKDPTMIKLAHTDPRLSNSGFCTMIMELSVAAKKDAGDLVYEDLTNSSIQEWIEQFESVAVQYGKSTGYLIRAMIQSGPSSINIAFLYENLIIDYGIQGVEEWNDRIVPIYPAEGSIHSDHPFCILDGAPWMTNETRTVADRFLEFLSEKDILIKATRHGFRVYDDSISLPEDVFNASNGISNSLPNKQMSIPADSQLLSRIEDLWLRSRPVF